MSGLYKMRVTVYYVDLVVRVFTSLKGKERWGAELVSREKEL